MKILVIRFSSIGDIVLTTPVIRCLKNQIDDVEIHVLTKKKFSSLYKTNPYINKVYEYDDSLKKNIEELKLENYDYIVDLQKNKRSIRVTRALHKPHSSFPKLNFKKFLLTTFKINLMPDIHIVDRYFKAVEKLGVKNDYQGLDFFISEKNDYPLSELPENFQEGYHAFVIGGTYKTKILPAVKVIEIIKKLNEPVILLGGPDDVERANEILDKISESQKLRISKTQTLSNSATQQLSNLDSQQLINLVGKINLEQSASIVKKAKSVLTNDTGLMHIAAAFHKNIVSVWGNTVPELGMYPYLPKEKEKCHIVECKGIKCRPCSKLGFKECPRKHFNCMMKIDCDTIVEKLKV
ncbi:MAG: glycosyltransferase family 9 protein [Bacteroidales bacterium]|nr:glycosyltransferase family 9 protein [Bacteroidales bacterium]